MYRRVDNLEVVGYTNSYLGGYFDDKRSTSGYIFMMAGDAISWKSKKQTLVASCTMQAEFIVCFTVVTHVVWLRNLMTRLSIMDSIARPLRILCDNNIVVFYTKNNKTSKGSKHLKLKCPTIRDLVKDGSIVVKHVDIDSMLVDPMTKGLKPVVFIQHVENMGIVSSFDMLG